MKILRIIILLALFSPFYSSAQKPKVSVLVNKLSNAPARPKLVVGIVVDQMRWDYLYRYANRYGSGGFNRLLNEGFTCENTHIPYLPTFTAPGHTSIYTGSVPAIHGIAGNDFLIQATGKSMYCTEDSAVNSVGSDSNAGKMSPANLLTTTITDELRLATNFRSKVIGIAIKDRGGILPAGHTANAAYWFDDSNGNWITSTYYMKELPAWVNSFNNQKLVEKYINQDWNTLYPIETYSQSTADDNRYEGKLSGEPAPVFPHYLSKMFKGKNYGLIRNSPYGNQLTLDFAKEVLKNEKLGKGTDTDFLTVSFSSTDYIGHNYGLNAIETEDTYLRLDKNLEDLFNTLDASVGKGQYTVFISSDHGAAHNPGFLNDHKIPAGIWPTSTVLENLNAALDAEFKQSKIAMNLNNYQVNFNNQLIEGQNLNLDAIKDFSIKFLKKQEGVSYAVDMEKASIASVPDALKSRIINGYNPERSGAIQIILKPGLFSGSPIGTTHGSWNPYDTHIPLVFMGWGIKHGSSNRLTTMADIAPTLAALLHIQEPNGNVGLTIEEVLKK